MGLLSTVAVPLVAGPFVHHLDQHVETLIDSAVKLLELLVFSLILFRELPNYVRQADQVLRELSLGRLEPLKPVTEALLYFGQLILAFARPLHDRFGSSVLLEDELDCSFYIHRPQLSTRGTVPSKIAVRIAYGATAIVTVFEGTRPLLSTSSTASPVGVPAATWALT